MKSSRMLNIHFHLLLFMLYSGFMKALQAVQEQKYDDIIPLCTEELKNCESETLPHKMEILLLRATFLLLLGKHDEAIKDFEDILSNNSASNATKVNALIKRATLYMQLEEPEKTFPDFELAVQIEPNCADIYHHRGQVQLLLGEIDKAKDDFDKAVNLNPNFGVVFIQKCYADYRYGVTVRDMAIIDQALKGFESAIEKFPDCVECYTLYAQLLSETQEYEKADSMYAKAIEKGPKLATTYVQRGLIQLHLNSNVDNAIEYIKKGLEVDNKCEFAYETLGTIEVQRGNLSEAIVLFDKALELSRTAMELTHIFSLKDAAKTQITIKETLDRIKP